ncbi:zinc-binding dehydrogenase [Enterococcus hulanensis]|uniref:alcohol dehydrogenase catalytic domain-containing protein n=1 Tax=Enterococcus hulanensis TaxID=2559929 RepID=UPI001A8F92A4|nr:zinc-binding dehydrogenase [Enterococcus hulanensis]MBO0455863.1 zinc-binding dehydrogenase [Enterococcus hulanensis]
MSVTTKAVRLHGVKDLRLEEFELPELQSDEILIKVITDSICMSTYKLAQQGEKHTRAPENLQEKPVIVGHEIAGVIVEVGGKWQDKYSVGQKFTIQPALNYKGRNDAPGYSYRFFGGDATYCIVPSEVMELDCLLTYEGDSFFSASLTEPVACVIAGFKRNYHTSNLNHAHDLGVKKGGKLLILGACGPMGLEAIDYAVHMPNGPKMVVAVDTSAERIERAEKVLRVDEARNNNVELCYHNPNDHEDSESELRKLSAGEGYDDVFVYAPIQSLIEEGDRLLADDGCLNFFAGPLSKELSAVINMYDIHYKRTHFAGYSGSVMEDMLEAIDLSSKGILNPTVMITHIGGLNAAAETTLNLPNLPGGKKLIYTHIDLPLTAIADFEKLGENNELFRQLDEACKRHRDCWNTEAEKILLAHFNIETELVKEDTSC